MKKTMVVVAGGLLLAACGSATKTGGSTASNGKSAAKAQSTSSAPASSSRTISEKQAAAAYQAAVNPANVALTKLGNEANNWNNNTPLSTVEAEFSPVESQLTETENKLNTLAVEYPPAAAALHNLTGAMSSLDGVLLSVSTVNAFDASTWVTQFDQALATAHNDANIVRSELGLPPAQ
jgi:ABC-type glycerol-3-phosphate transport system substrate-binding protein